MRITDKRLQERLNLIHDPTLELHYSYGRVQMVRRCEQGGYTSLSNLLSNSEMWEWMGGYLAAQSVITRPIKEVVDVLNSEVKPFFDYDYENNQAENFMEIKCTQRIPR